MARGKKTGGRQKGTPNKLNAAVKDMILQALHEAHEQGAVEYLKKQSADNPTAFLTLVGKLVPMDMNANVSGGAAPISLTLIRQPEAPSGD